MQFIPEGRVLNTVEVHQRSPNPHEAPVHLSYRPVLYRRRQRLLDRFQTSRDDQCERVQRPQHYDAVAGIECPTSPGRHSFHQQLAEPDPQHGNQREKDDQPEIDRSGGWCGLDNQGHATPSRSQAAGDGTEGMTCCLQPGRYGPRRCWPVHVAASAYWAAWRWNSRA